MPLPFHSFPRRLVFIAQSEIAVSNNEILFPFFVVGVGGGRADKVQLVMVNLLVGNTRTTVASGLP